jgi:rfaE bifunctional protein nucleotidyltransferase chain/domain
LVFEEKITPKIFSPDELLKRVNFWRKLGETIVFTNGCFDILHPGHIHLLASCSGFGDHLIVGVNSDASVKRLKGKGRPVNNIQARLTLLASLQFTDAVLIFEENTPEKLIHVIKPDVLAKGGDWRPEDIVGSTFVMSYGGKVKTVPYLKGYSTTEIIKRSKG